MGTGICRRRALPARVAVGLAARAALTLAGRGGAAPAARADQAGRAERLAEREPGWHGAAAELRRTLFALEALLALHLAAEEEALAELAGEAR